MIPNYDLDKIRFATDGPTFKRAVDLYEKNKIKKFQPIRGGFSALVLGTKPYRVLVSARHYDQGSCECYLGQHETLCKHLVALAIYAVKRGKPLSKEEKQHIDEPKCSGHLGKLNPEEWSNIKKSITAAMRYIKPYTGPSRIWFAYQDSLSEGCRRLSVLISKLPVNQQTAALLVKMLLRLDKKLCFGGVDDSDGTVGIFIEQTVEVLKEYARLDPACRKAFEILREKETCFGWEEPLLVNSQSK